MKAVDYTGEAPVVTRLKRVIVHPGGEAAKATRAQADRQASNGADEGARRLMQDTESGEAHTHFWERTRGCPRRTRPRPDPQPSREPAQIAQERLSSFQYSEYRGKCGAGTFFPGEMFCVL
jgi:hypothetical protein